MKLAFATIVVVLAAACGSDDMPGRNDEEDRQQVQSCVANGGTPYFTTDSAGNVEFITCDTTTNS